MVPLAIILFVVLTRNFYTGDPSAGTYSSHFLEQQAKTKPSISLLLVPVLELHPHFEQQLLPRVCVLPLSPIPKLLTHGQIELD
jgi:hypothetical protein